MHSSVQKGFSVVEVVIVLVVVSVLGFAGYVVYDRQNNKTADSTSNVQTGIEESPTANDVASPPSSINSTSDLDEAAAMLDNIDPGESNSTDTAQLDSQLSGF